MELFPNRGYFFCRYCSSFHFPETTTSEGVRVLAESRDPRACPACKRTLSSALLDEAHAVHYCTNCRGVLVSRGTFADVVRVRRAWATGTPTRPIPPEESEFARRVHCPICSHALETHPYFGPGNVVIDSCATCDVIWLDFGELKQIVDAPGRDRGGREAVTPKSNWSPDATTGRALMNRGDDNGPDLLGLLGRLLD